MKNLPICGDSVKLLDNLKEAAFTYLGTIKGSITKIVTKTEILALVSFPSGNICKWKRHIFGDMLNWQIIWMDQFFLFFATIKCVMTKIVTKAEILAMVPLLWGTNFICYRPVLGDKLLFHIWHISQSLLEKEGR